MNTSRILIVDDEPWAREMMQEMLEREGYLAFCAGSAEEALHLAEEEQFDLLLADIIMPHVDGLELIQRFQERSPDTVPMLITGYASVETAQAAMRQGVYDYIVKPFERADLCVAVSKALRRKRLSVEDSRLKELVGLYKVSESMVTSPEQREVLDFVLSAAVQQTRSSGGAIILFDTRRRGLVIASAIGAWEPATRVANLVLEKGIDSWITEMGSPCLYTNIDDHCLLGRVRKLDTGYPLLGDNGRALEMLLLPVRSERETFGVLSVYKEGVLEPLSQSDLELLTILATQAGLSVKSRQSFSELEEACLATLNTLAAWIGGRTGYTRDHMERVAQLSEQLAWRIGLGEHEVKAIAIGAGLHDIGLIGVSELILNQPGELAPREWDVMKLHPVIGDEVLAPLTFLAQARVIVRGHHERLDGSGYPDGLYGDEVPLSVRIVSLADAYDAMTSQRPWRNPLSREEAIAAIEADKGTKFDPDIADAFIDMLREQP